MLRDPFRNCLVLTGPTGSGKTSLGIDIAERLGAEIVSMDSMAVYRRMNVGTAKPDAQSARRVRHHLIDELEPWESATVAWWLRQAEVRVREIEARGKRVLFVGGTPLYLKALLHGLFDGPPASPPLRERLGQEVETAGPGELLARLAEVDPATAGRLHPNDTRRIVRALEVWELTGRPISSWQSQWKKEAVACRESREPLSYEAPVPETEIKSLHPARVGQVLWLDLPRSELYARINARVTQMILEGLVAEVKGLLESHHALGREAAQALGYKEIIEYLRGRATLEEAVGRIQTRTRNFAKRQITWFRHIPECQPVSRELTFAALGLKMDVS
jgi:tRNA dimethylallyltransferase